ncbi:unnamed protein product [Auanema sp. JU1783]|nr:unnamed protein product [Auanema sp. JU1783]
MPFKFLVDGHELICSDENDFEVIKEKFKKEVTVDDQKNWQTVDEMVKYTATDFIKKARHYLKLSPPDLLQSAEKTWLAAAYAVKELYLSCGRINPMSHYSLKYFYHFAIEQSPKSFAEKYKLRQYWTKAEKMHRHVYGSERYQSSTFELIISQVEKLVQELEQIDRAKLLKSFEEDYIIKSSDPTVVIKKEDCKITLGGVEFNVDYSVYV